MVIPVRLRTPVAVLYGLPFIWVGVMHFVNPEVFMAIVPPYLGAPRFWVLLTGVTEIALGLGVMWPKTRRLACVWMILQLGLLYLANLHMWWNDVAFDGFSFGPVGHAIRFVIQLVLMAIAGSIGGLWQRGNPPD
jgi:uncharacterized membrane protein